MFFTVCNSIFSNFFNSKLSSFVLIGEVKENNWLCYVQNEIKALNICRLQEAVVFFEKMVNEEIPLKMLYKSIKTSKK